MLTKPAGLQNNTSTPLGVLMEHFPDMIHSVDRQGNLVFFNKMAMELTGYSEEELTGMNIRQLYAPEILDAVEKGFGEVKQSGEKHVESLFVARDGTRIPVEIRTLAIRDAAGSFVQTFSITRDIRRLKETQDSMLRAGRLAAISELAAGVAYDINTPLSSFAVGLSMLQQQLLSCKSLPSYVRDQTNELFAMLNDSASNMEGVVARLRDFARGTKENDAPVDVADSIQNALLAVGSRLNANKVQVDCQVPKAKHWIFGDCAQLDQVFINLFANAYDAMEKRDLRALTVAISPETKEGRPFWHCTVSDTGEGIRPEDRERVFKAFYTTKPSGTGAGLGLSLVRSILIEHGGAITAESEFGQGATFHVWLPVYSPRASFAKPPAAS